MLHDVSRYMGIHSVIDSFDRDLNMKAGCFRLFEWKESGGKFFLQPTQNSNFGRKNLNVVEPTDLNTICPLQVGTAAKRLEIQEQVFCTFTEVHHHLLLNLNSRAGRARPNDEEQRHEEQNQEHNPLSTHHEKASIACIFIACHHWNVMRDPSVECIYQHIGATSSLFSKEPEKTPSAESLRQ